MTFTKAKKDFIRKFRQIIENNSAKSCIIARKRNFYISLDQGCRIPGSGGAQAPPVFRTLSHKNAIKLENLRF